MNCSICQNNSFDEIFTTNAPISSALLYHEQFKTLQNVKLDIVKCRGCGFVFNKNFNEELVYAQYSNKDYVVKQAISPSMSKNLKKIVDFLTQYNGRSWLSIEIGCGSGELTKLLSTSFKKSVGFDPSLKHNVKFENIEFQKAYFTNEMFFTYPEADLVIARHLLEHLVNPNGFVQVLSQYASNSTYFYIEVPNLKDIADNNRFYDFFSDHYGYYTQETLVNLFFKYDLELVSTLELFNGQHIGCIFKKRSYTQQLSPSKYNFKFDFLTHIDNFSKRVQLHRSVCIWGAGAQGVTLYNYLNNEAKQRIQCFVDNDPQKTGLYLPSSNIQIQPSDSVDFNDFNAVVISSSLYVEEILSTLRQIGFNGEILVP